ncbi:uncharacterized protein LOC127812713 [Diospyros lotus]|uniref:uncharacterized protein LOC127812713 n=1 Tax=Diospyros lotus TaxID=55363 RepID=UPI002250F21E|nr:uncharacterized protein LOC127812713 [Diospyros lotus]
MDKMRGMHTGLMQVMNTIAANQGRQGSQEAGGNGGAPPVVPVVLVAPTALVATDHGTQLLKDFMAFRPPEFHGGTDASAIENWMLAIEKHHRSIGCVDDHRVRLGTFLLRGDTKRWWETARQRFGEREPTWAEFQEVFNAAYCPTWVREQTVYEFIDLAQGNKIVAQYEAEFTTLA